MRFDLERVLLFHYLNFIETILFKRVTINYFLFVPTISLSSSVHWNSIRLSSGWHKANRWRTINELCSGQLSLIKQLFTGFRKLVLGNVTNLIIDLMNFIAWLKFAKGQVGGNSRRQRPSTVSNQSRLHLFCKNKTMIIQAHQLNCFLHYNRKQVSKRGKLVSIILVRMALVRKLLGQP